ncbi:MAG: hypothetical protein F4X08_11680 [Gemmatimonadetes bacterium]|nr:hypothetical protein [Gemmatimonadota bacterium]MYD26462.1 hypothetical protein [Gemmatimonadota bacterium]MYI99014.1 hypothetical protein [Gemmatimonadota bacterium]
MTPSPRYLSEEQLAQFWSEGYLVLKGTLDDEVVNNARGFLLDLIPRDLVIPDHYHANHARFKPHNPDGNGSFFEPAMLPLLQNEGLYGAAVDILETEYIQVWDGSAGITLRNRAMEGRLQNLHLDAVPKGPEELNEGFLRTGIGIGGCYYLNKVEDNGGGIHVVPGAPNRVREIMLSEPDGLKRNDGWGKIVDFKSSMEVTGDAGDYVLMHHLMPHSASANHNASPRIAQFTRLQPLSEEEARQAPGPDRPLSADALAALTPLGRKMFRLDPWIG